MSNLIPNAGSNFKPLPKNSLLKIDLTSLSHEKLLDHAVLQRAEIRKLYNEKTKADEESMVSDRDSRW